MEGVPELAHVHLGPGSLGLGLVASTTLKAGMSVHLVAREGCQLAPSQLSVTRYGDHGHRIGAPSQLAVETLSCAGCAADLQPAAAAAVRAAPSLLLTTALGARGLGECADLILDIVDQRPPELRASTVCIPAEGHPGRDWPALEERLLAMGVDCRRTMVDRFCRVVAKAERAIECEVHAEDFAEWMIEGQADSPVLAALDDVEYTRFVPDVEPHQVRRRWLVECGRLALALWERPQRRPPGGDEQVSERLSWLERFGEPVLRSFERRYPDLGDPYPDLANPRDYMRDQIQIWGRHGAALQGDLDSLHRVHLDYFFDDVERKLLEPLVAVREDGDDWPEMVAVFDAIHELLSDFSEYADGPALDRRDATLTEAHDDELIERYRAITDDVFEQRVSRTRVRQLTRAFAAHRARYDEQDLAR